MNNIDNEIIIEADRENTNDENIEFSFDEKCINKEPGYNYLDGHIRKHHKKIIIFDSINQDDNINGSGKISWNLCASSVFNDGSYQTVKNIRDIVGVKLYSPQIMFPQSLIQYSNYISRYTILIEEFASQSFIGPENQNFHFMFTYSYTRRPFLYNTLRYSVFNSYQIVDKTPYGGNYSSFTNPNVATIEDYNIAYPWDMTVDNFNKGYYWFNNPIREISRITLSMGNPFTKIPILPTKYNGVIVQNSNPMTIRIESNIIDDGAVVLPVSDLSSYIPLTSYFTISGFTTGDPVTDIALINSVNTILQPSDYNASELIFDIDLSAMTPKDGDIKVVLRADNKIRHIFPMEIIYLHEEKNAT